MKEHSNSPIDERFEQASATKSLTSARPHALPRKGEAVIVESTIAVRDAMELDIQFHGAVRKRGVIKLRLDIERIKSSTTPFKPNTKAVSKCIFVLSPA